MLYGVVALVIAALLLGIELWFAGSSTIGSEIFPKSISFGGVKVPYPIEVATVVIILVAYLGKVLQLALLRARNRYELREDGLYVDSGILNLQEHVRCADGIF